MLGLLLLRVFLCKLRQFFRRCGVFICLVNRPGSRRNGGLRRLQEDLLGHRAAAEKTGS
jgi:hypothetical protein